MFRCLEVLASEDDGASPVGRSGCRLELTQEGQTCDSRYAYDWSLGCCLD